MYSSIIHIIRNSCDSSSSSFYWHRVGLYKPLGVRPRASSSIHFSMIHLLFFPIVLMLPGLNSSIPFVDSFSLILTQCPVYGTKLSLLVVWGCRIHRHLLCRGVRLPFNECPVYDTKLSILVVCGCRTHRLLFCRGVILPFNEWPDYVTKPSIPVIWGGRIHRQLLCRCSSNAGT